MDGLTIMIHLHQSRWGGASCHCKSVTTTPPHGNQNSLDNTFVVALSRKNKSYEDMEAVEMKYCHCKIPVLTIGFIGKKLEKMPLSMQSYLLACRINLNDVDQCSSLLEVELIVLYGDTAATSMPLPILCHRVVIAIHRTSMPSLLVLPQMLSSHQKRFAGGVSKLGHKQGFNIGIF
jgi:hypothetical protein